MESDTHMNNAEQNTSKTEDGQTQATTSLSNLLETLTKLALLNGKVLIAGELATEIASELHSSVQDGQTRRNLRLLIGLIAGSSDSTLNYQSGLISILKLLSAQATSSTRSLKETGGNNE